MNHSWATRDGWVVCTLCGLVRHHDRPESPCRGPAKIALCEATGRELGEARTERDEARSELAKARTELAEMTGCATRWCAAAGRAGRERDEALTRCRTAARTLTDAIGASGFVALEEAARRAVEALEGARADAHRFREERDDLRGQLYRTREDRQRLGRELDEARTELEEVRAARDGALVKLECLDDHRRADSELIDRLTYALRNLVDSVTLEARDLEAARALIKEAS